MSKRNRGRNTQIKAAENSASNSNGGQVKNSGESEESRSAQDSAASLPVQPSKQSRKSKNDKRKNAFWDSIYTGRQHGVSTQHNWNFRNNKGPSSLIFDAVNLELYVRAEGLKRFSCRDISFQDCDIEGDYKGLDVVFSKCSFKKCDFGESVWREAKFSECTFDSCSFTLAEFEACQFYNCKWNKITASGTETKFINTLITNPGAFVDSMYTNTNPEILSSRSTTVGYQIMRLENTKLKMARLLNKGAELYGDESAYYESIKTKINQSIKASKIEAIYNFKAKKNRFNNAVKIVAGLVEYAILNCSASINAWGRSIVRPSMLGLMIMLLFGMCYGEQVGSYKQGLIQGFDITFLVGYTKYASVKDDLVQQSLYALNAFLGLWWYAILVPTLINRLNRSG